MSDLYSGNPADLAMIQEALGIKPAVVAATASAAAAEASAAQAFAAEGAAQEAASSLNIHTDDEISYVDVAQDDEFPLYDVSAGGRKKLTFGGVIAAIFNPQTLVPHARFLSATFGLFKGEMGAPVSVRFDLTALSADRVITLPDADVALGGVAPYVSPEQTIAASTAITLTHGLGYEPNDVKAWLVCKTAEHGYAAGAKVDIASVPVYIAGSDWFGIQSSKPNATTINVSFANLVPYITPKTGGAALRITAGNWRLVVRAV